MNILKYQIICSPPERQPWQQSYYDDGVKMTKMERQATLSTAPGLNHSAQQELCAPTIAPCCETCVTDSREILCIFVFNCTVLVKMMMGDMFMISLVHAVD